MYKPFYDYSYIIETISDGNKTIKKYKANYADNLAAILIYRFIIFSI